MKLILAHYKAETLELLRQPGYLIPTMLFPSMFFLFFAAPHAQNPSTANFLYASFAAYAVFGVAFFQFGLGVAQDRATPWATYLRTLPLPPFVRVAARTLSALSFASLAALVVTVTAYAATPVALDGLRGGRLALGLAAGSIPAALMGVALGYWASPRSALPLANLLFFPLSFAGGLWLPPQELPGIAARISPYLPTRQWAEVVWPAVLGEAWTLKPWLWLLGYTLAFAFLATWGFRRDEGVRYR